MVERYQLSSHALGDAVNAQYDAHYAGEAPGVGGKHCDSADSATIPCPVVDLFAKVNDSSISHDVW